MISKEELLKLAEAKNIKLTDEQLKKLDSIQELSKDELDAVNGGYVCSAPDAPTCPKCGGHNTWSAFEFITWRGYCRVCKNSDGSEYWWTLK